MREHIFCLCWCCTKWFDLIPWNSHYAPMPVYISFKTQVSGPCLHFTSFSFSPKTTQTHAAVGMWLWQPTTGFSFIAFIQYGKKTVPKLPGTADAMNTSVEKPCRKMSCSPQVPLLNRKALWGLPCEAFWSVPSHSAQIRRDERIM